MIEILTKPEYCSIKIATIEDVINNATTYSSGFVNLQDLTTIKYPNHNQISKFLLLYSLVMFKETYKGGIQ